MQQLNDAMTHNVKILGPADTGAASQALSGISRPR